VNVTPENLASATAPGTMPAAVAATPKAVVTLSPTAAPSGSGETQVEEFTLDEATGSGTPGDRAVSAKLVALARSKLRSRDAAGAAEMMLRQVTADPEDHHAMEVLIRAWIAMGRGDDAVSYAELIVKKRPRRAAYRVLEGDARLAAGDPAGAQVAWRVALQLEPENVEAKRRLGIP
jgi:Flp pilus assembly protein TadD